MPAVPHVDVLRALPLAAIVSLAMDRGAPAPSTRGSSATNGSMPRLQHAVQRPMLNEWLGAVSVICGPTRHAMTAFYGTLFPCIRVFSAVCRAAPPHPTHGVEVGDDKEGTMRNIVQHELASLSMTEIRERAAKLHPAMPVDDDDTAEKIARGCTAFAGTGGVRMHGPVDEDGAFRMTSMQGPSQAILAKFFDE